MFKCSFKCYNEGLVREEINNMMMRDLPIGKSIFGREYFRRGIHFTECGEKVKGYYIASDEGGRRGSVSRVVFNGKFVQTDEGTLFDVYIYPKILEVVFLLFCTIAMISSLEPIAIIMSSFVFVMFIRGYIRDIKETSEYLNGLISL